MKKLVIEYSTMKHQLIIGTLSLGSMYQYVKDSESSESRLPLQASLHL